MSPRRCSGGITSADADFVPPAYVRTEASAALIHHALGSTIFSRVKVAKADYSTIYV